MGLKLTHQIADWGIPVYGLAKGNVERQIGYSINKLAGMGITSMVLHASEYMRAMKEDATVRQILHTYFGQLAESARSVLFVGVLKPNWLPYFELEFPKGPKPSYAGLSWFLDAERGRVYSDPGHVDAASKYVRCGCATCANIKPMDLMTDLGARARHNLNYLIERVTNPSREHLQLVGYDLILGEDEKALLVSDLHLWTGRALLDNFIAFLRDQRPTHIAFLGDVFDLKGRPDLEVTRMFFEALRELGALVFVAKGCSDSDQDDFLSASDELTMGSQFMPTLWIADEKRHATQTYVDLYRFYRCAKKQLTIMLADRRLIVAKHGHDVIDDASAPSASIARALEEARTLVRKDILEYWVTLQSSLW
jgi:hypothetical protein